MSIIRCGCGRTFLSEAALEQHRRDKTAWAPASPCANIKVTPVPSSAAMESSEGPAIHNPEEQWLAKGAGKVVDTLTSASLMLSNSEPSISSSNHHDLICSYNWVNQKRPAVYVPGGAPILKAISLPMTVKPDIGHFFTDQNANKVPDYPFEVVFQAAELMNPTVRFDEIDVLTDRPSLRNFFTFCEGGVQGTFRVNLHLVNDTLIIERCVKSTSLFLNGLASAGFRHNFETAMTRWPGGLENSSGHYSVLRYDFGGLKCAVRCEVNASYDVADTLGESGSGSTGGPADKTGSGSTGGSADTICRGVGTEQSRIAELKGQRGHQQNANPNWLPQLWFGRMQYLIVGYHEKGTFDGVRVYRVHDLRKRMNAWEKSDANQKALQKVAMLLSRLRDIVRATQAKSCVLISEEADKPPVLRVHESTSGKGPLPASVVEKFWSKGKH